ncbi:MAG: hypothetical protein IT350_03315 [Deltaproteobacteria bacterium]|nr:hypothetical protein [Deltaproteobacteria bacterium]
MTVETRADRVADDDSPRRTLLIVFILSFTTLLFELLLSRMSVFYLNYANSFIAIPLTLFGLAVGSLRVHLGRTKPDDIDIRRDLVALAAVAAGAFAASFAIYSSLFPITYRGNLASATQVAKTLIFVGVFLPPFFFVGKILTTLYARNRAIIGRLYGIDLAGAAAACFVTPLAIHVIDLPHIIAAGLFALTALVAIATRGARVRTVVALVAASALVWPSLVWLEGRYDLTRAIGREGRATVTELAHRWNAYSRVSLLRVEKSKSTHYEIIHDNAESNVTVRRYHPEGGKRDSMTKVLNLEKLGRPTDDILVMFAGCGAQMIEFHERGMGQKSIVGVEINPLVTRFAAETPELADFRIQEFYDRPNVDVVVMEGRRYLDTHPTQFDVIYVANNAATSQYKSGHSRKYLDTYEAMASYLDHMRDDALLIYRCQPLEHLVQIFQVLFQERGLGDLGLRAMIVEFSGGKCVDMIVSKKPFTADEVAGMKESYPKSLLYAPGVKNRAGEAGLLLEGPTPAKSEIVTDDRPYIEKLLFSKFTLIPSKKQIDNRGFYRSWIKIITLVIVCAVLVAIVAALYLKRAPMPPAPLMLYLVITGFCYMLVEIALLGKLDLFLENPLYSMALLLSLFLLTNAAGSMLYGRYGSRLPMNVMPLIMAAISFAGLYAMETMIGARIGMPLPLKILLTALALAPVGAGLGLFYPHVVTELTRTGRADAVPVTYGLSTLSSVAGATYAMTLVINIGYASLVYQAIIGYAALALMLGVFALAGRAKA